MKLQKLLIALFIVLAGVASAQNINVTYQSHLAYPGQTCANICGYVDSLGNEYALVGASIGLSIVDVTVPSAPTQVYQHVGPTGNQAEWQEIKVRGKYAYVTTEAGGGLQIFNLSSLPDVAGITMVSWTGNGAIAGQLNSIHALHIDGHYVYLYGSNLFNGGVVAADITNPMSPVYAGNYSMGTGQARYVHDGYVRNDTGYFAHIYLGYYTVVDFTNKANPIELASQYTTTNFTHNTWLSTNSKTLFTTDENTGSFLTSYDVSDLTNIQALDKIQSNPGSGSIVHNTHILRVAGNDYAITSWYKDGFTITDVGRPQNMVQVGNYDTYPTGSGDGFNGDWGVYPFLPSGTIVVSNIEDGLFVFSPNYVRACYLEGVVTDSITGLPINTASVQIVTSSVIKYSNLSGNYATGLPSPGATYSVTYSKAGYVSKTITGVSLSAGVVTVRDVQLAPLPTYSVSGQIVTAGTGAFIANANVIISSPTFNFQTISNSSGHFSFPAVFADSYNITAGKWGYVTNCSQNVSVTAATTSVTDTLSIGYYDDFTFDFGWTATSTATTGAWVRDIPLGTDDNGTTANPNVDDQTDCSNKAFVTGNTGLSSFDDDIDGGAVILTSPIFDLSTYVNPALDFSYWFYNSGGTGTPNDSIRIYLNNGTITNQVYFANVSTANNGTWVHKTFNIPAIITPSASMKVIVRSADANPGHIVEAGFDKFFITEGSSNIGIKESNDEGSIITIFPNPFTDKATIVYELKNKLSDNSSVVINDIAGRMIEQHKINSPSGTLTLAPSINAGIYFVKIINGNEISKPGKVMKMK